MALQSAHRRPTKWGRRMRSTAWALAAVLLPLTIQAGDGQAAETAHRGVLDGKFGYCTDCHGRSGQGYYGYYVMPRLAGQTRDYVESQLRAFAEQRRMLGGPVRMSRVHALEPGMRAAMAERFSRLETRPFGHAPSGLAATGRQIYQDGVPEANVPACAACHGANAEGSNEVPRLAGQLARYTRRQLANWPRLRGQESSRTEGGGLMQLVAASMSKSQIEAVAAYLNNLK